MDLVAIYSDFFTVPANVTITHPNPLLNQTVTCPMIQQGCFASHRESAKCIKYGKAARVLGAKFVP